AGDAAPGAAIAAARSGRPSALARAELATSLALGRHAGGLVSSGHEPLAFVDPRLARPSDVGAVLAQAAHAPSLAGYVAGVAEANPIYAQLGADLQAYRRTWSRLPQVQIPFGAPLRFGDRDRRVALLRTRLGLAGDAATAFDDGLAQAVRRFQ